MLMIAIICLFVATMILAVGVCFTKKNKSLSFLLQTLSLISLISLGIVAGNYKNNFSGYTILILLSITPQFLTLFDLKEYLKTKKTSVELAQESKLQVEFDTEVKKKETKPKRLKKYHFLNSNGTLIQSISLILSAICIGLCGLYIGLETYYGFLIGLAIAFSLTFLFLIIKKTANPYDLLGWFLIFLASGIMIGQIITVLLYSFSITNILFCTGALIYCGYIALVSYLKSNFDHLAYYAAMICLLCSLII